VRGQTYRNIEIIVCDNFSDDDTVDIARRYGARIFFRGRERAAQKNFAAKQADGEIFYFIDSDFVLERDTVQRCVQYIGKADAVVTVNRSGGEGLWARSIAYKRELLADEESVIAARFIRRQCFFEVGGFDEELIVGEDVDLHRRLLEEGFHVRRAEAVEWHIGEPETFRELVLRNYYYGKALRGYLRKNRRAIAGHLKPFKLSLLRGIVREPSLLLISLAIFQIALYIVVSLGLITGTKAIRHGFNSARIKRAKDRLRINVLYLHESSLPKKYTEGVISEREMRLIQEMNFVGKIYAVGKGENSYVGIAIGEVEPKIEVLPVPLSEYIRGLFLYHVQVLLGALVALKRGNIRVVHATSPIWSGLVAIFLSKVFKIPCIVEVRTNYNRLIHFRYGRWPLIIKRAFVRLLMEFTLTRSNAVIANSEFHKKECISLGVSPCKLFEVTPGVAIDEEKIAKFKKKKQKRFTVGFVGRITELKGLDYLIRAIHYLLHEREFKDFKVLIVGDGDARKQIEGLSRKLKVDEHVSFVGMTSNPFRWMCKFDVLVNPTLVLEALSMVNLEAYACKIPALTFGNGVLPETVIDGETGFILKPGDYEVLAEKIIELHNKPRLRKKLGNQGRAYLEKKYVFERQVESLRTCLKQLVLQK
jgi:glycosyltransferase involved in cell wall biosynthesis